MINNKKMRLKQLSMLVMAMVSFCSCSNSDSGYAGEMLLSNNYLAVGENLVVGITKASRAEVVSWDFGDGTTSAEKSTVHQYDNEGEYTVSLTVDGAKFAKVVQVEGVGLTKKLEELQAKEEILVMAHRANMGNMAIPENSVEAIKACIAAGVVDVVEIDLRKTKDGEIVLMHDADIFRTTTGAGAVSSLTLKEIKHYNLKDRNMVETQYKVPTLKEVLMAGRGKLFFDFDLGGRTDIAMIDIYRVMKETGTLDRVLIYTATNAKVGETWLMMDKFLHVYPFYSTNVAGVVDYLADYDRTFFTQIDANHVLTGNHVKEIVDRGLLVSVNMFVYDSQIKVNDFVNVQNIIDASEDNVTMMQTDYPVQLHNYLKTINKK